MKLNSLLSLFLLASPFVYANECSNIDSEYKNNVKECKVNDKGQITSLDLLAVVAAGDKDLSQLLTKDLTELSYTIRGTFIDNSEFPSAIKDLTNLESLVIAYDFFINPCTTSCQYVITSPYPSDTLKNLKNLKSLTLKGIYVSQDNIDEISTLSNLETLIFEESYLDDSLNYESISKLENLKRLDIKNIRLDYIKRADGEIDDPNDFYYGFNNVIKPVTPTELINANQSLKELNLEYFENKNIENLPTSIERLKLDTEYRIDSNDIENLKNLTYLTIKHLAYEPMGPYTSHYPEFSMNLSKLAKLKELVIDHRDITDKMMDEILNIPNLNKLTIIDSHTSKENLEKLENSDRISSIKINIYSEHNIEFDNVVAEFKSNSSETSTVTTEITTTVTKTTVISTIETTTTTTEVETTTKTSTEVPTPTNTNQEVKISLNGRCGKEYGVCRKGYCCSKWGWCGQSDVHCKVENGCNSEFGDCNAPEKDPKDDNNENTSDKKVKISENGRCGEEFGSCREGFCCSKWGWCGQSETHCKVENGCNSEFGECK